MDKIQKVDDNTIIWFGAHKGKALANVPEGWLMWWYNNCNRERLTGPSLGLLNYIKENIKIISAGAVTNSGR